MDEKEKEKGKEPEVDESLLTPAQLEEYHKKPKTLFWGLLFLGFLVVIIALVVVIKCLPAGA